MRYSIVKYSALNDDKRLDSEYYDRRYLLTENIIANKNNDILENLSIKITDFGAYSQNSFIEYRKNEYAKFIRNQDVNEFFIETEDSPQIEKEVYERLSLKVNTNDLLIQRTASLGKCGIVYDCNLPATANQNIAQIVINNQKINPYYVLTFLNCYFGKIMFSRLQTGNVQPWLNLTQIKTLRVPIPVEKIQTMMQFIVEKAYFIYNRSKNSYNHAQRMLQKELGLANYNLCNTLTYIQKFTKVQAAGRFDAEYFQPKYEEIVESIKDYSNGWDYLKNCIEVIDKNHKPIDNKEYKYVELSNINANGYISDCTTDIGENLPSRARRLVKTDNVIVSSIEGSLESIALVDKEYNHALCSTGFYVLNSQHLNPQTLLVLLKSIAGQMQLKQGCNGTILTAINKDYFGNIVIPKIRKEIQEKIKELVDESSLARNKSQKLLNTAKRAVEIAIEQDEDKAIRWIEEQVNSLE